MKIEEKKDAMDDSRHKPTNKIREMKVLYPFLSGIDDYCSVRPFIGISNGTFSEFLGPSLELYNSYPLSLGGCSRRTNSCLTFSQIPETFLFDRTLVLQITNYLH